MRRLVVGELPITSELFKDVLEGWANEVYDEDNRQGVLQSPSLSDESEEEEEGGGGGGDVGGGAGGAASSTAAGASSSKVGPSDAGGGGKKKGESDEEGEDYGYSGDDDDDDDDDPPSPKRVKMEPPASRSFRRLRHIFSLLGPVLQAVPHNQYSLETRELLDDTNTFLDQRSVCLGRTPQG